MAIFRKRNGSITVTGKDGKISGNLGAGQHNVPTAQPITVHHRETLTNNAESTPLAPVESFIKRQQAKFENLQKKNKIDRQTPETNIGLTEKISEVTPEYDNFITIWNLMASQPFESRLDVAANLFPQLSETEKQQFFAEHLPAPKHNDELYDAVGSNLSPQACDMLAQYNLNATIQGAALTNHNASPETRLAHVNDSSSYVLRQVAYCLPLEYKDEVTKLIQKGDDQINISLIAREDVTPEIISEIYSSDPSFHTISDIAGKYATPPEILENIYLSTKNTFNNAQQGNPYTDNTHCYMTMIHLADNPHTPHYILSEFSAGSGGMYGKVEARIIANAKKTLHKIGQR